MPLMEWNDKKMSVGITTFDDDHQQIVGMLNELFDGVQAGRTKDVLGMTLEKLLALAGGHFSREEEYMARYGYTDLASHKAEHQRLTGQVVELKKKYQSGQTITLSIEVLAFLKALVKHIQEYDRKYGSFFNAKGVK